MTPRFAAALAIVLLPGTAEAGKLAAPYAEAVLEPIETYVGGTVRGPESSRAIWTRLGAIQPFTGDAMAVFSTGELELPAIPGTDLGTAGPAVDINIQLDLVLEPPDWASSLRFAYAVIAPADVSGPQSAAIVDDACSVVLSSGIGLDPWTRTALGPLSAAFQQGPEGALADVSWLAGTRATGWIEAIVPIRPQLGNVTFTFLAREGGDDPLYDIICLLDGLAFDRGIPVGVGPGLIPRLDRISPAVTAPGRVADLVLEGRDLPMNDVEFSILDPEGIVEHVLAPDVDALRSTERVVLPLPALTNGPRGLRITWPGGAMSWTSAFEVRTVPPRIEAVAPAVGPPEGGNRISLRGTGFYDVTSVVIGDRQATADDIVLLSPEHLEVLVPGPGVAVGLVDISLTAGGLNTTAPDVYTLSATEEQTAEIEAPDPGGPSASCSQASGSWPPVAPFASLLLLGARSRRQGRSPN